LFVYLIKDRLGISRQHILELNKIIQTMFKSQKRFSQKYLAHDILIAKNLSKNLVLILTTDFLLDSD